MGKLSHYDKIYCITCKSSRIPHNAYTNLRTIVCVIMVYIQVIHFLVANLCRVQGSGLFSLRYTFYVSPRAKLLHASTYGDRETTEVKKNEGDERRREEE